MTARPLPFLLLLAACGPSRPALVAGAAGHGAPESVVLILLDTLRVDYTSLHEGGRDITPFLAELASRGVVFERAYAAASWTRASTATLFTSRLPAAHACEDRDGMLAPELVTLAEALGERGYSARGLVANANVVGELGFAQGFERYERVTPGELGYGDAEVLRAELDLLLDGLASPYFLYLHYLDPHAPYHWREGTHVAAEYEPPFDTLAEKLELRDYRIHREERGFAHDQRIRDLYESEVAWLDARLRELVGDLEARGLLDDAWLVVTSDHGEGLWTHAHRGHGMDVFEEQLRVPLIVVPPGGRGSGARVREPISLVDVAPTLLDLVGVPVPDEFRGRSWAPFLRGLDAPPVRPVVVDHFLQPTKKEGAAYAWYAAIVDGDDKLVWDRRRETVRLTDLAADPNEKQHENVPVEETPPGRASELLAALRAELDAAAAERPDEERSRWSGKYPEELVEQLRALGYMGDGDDEP